MKQYFRCLDCGVKIGVEQYEQDDTQCINPRLIRFPNKCHEEQGGCGRNSMFILIENPSRTKIEIILDKTKKETDEKCDKNDIEIHKKEKPIEKICSKCHISKPLTEFCTNRSSKDGKRARCKSCQKIEYAKWHENKKQKELRHVKGNDESIFDWSLSPNSNQYHDAQSVLIKQGRRACHSCKKILSLEKFYVRKDGKLCSDCKKCKISIDSKYYHDRGGKQKAHLRYLKKMGGSVDADLQKTIIEPQSNKQTIEIIDATKCDALPLTNIPESIDERNVDSIIKDSEKRKRFFQRFHNDSY